MRSLTSGHRRYALRRFLATPGFVLLLVAGGLYPVCDARAAWDIFVNFVVDNRQEVPPSASNGGGGGMAIIDTDANTLSYEIAFTGLSSAETAAHIHGPADPGVNAGVLVALPAGNPKVGVWNYPEALEADILAGRTYVNIHSVNFGGGELRGQIVTHNALLDGDQENPPAVTAANGWGVFVINTTTNQLKYYIAFGNLSSAETAAHIHGFALHGTNAGVLQALPAGNPKVGIWNYAEAQEEGILSGRTYVNIHTVNFGGGEIRGQICPIVVPIHGGQEVPPNASPGAGIGLIAHDLNTDNLSYDIRVGGLSSAETAAHIHGWAPRGQNAGVLQALPAGARKLGVWNFGAANQPSIIQDLAYINIHSVNFGGGEIRGQIVGGWTLPAADVPDAETAGFMRLAPNAPNPFQGVTRIEFNLDHQTPARLAIYDNEGRLLRNVAEGEFTSGPHTVQWDGLDGDGRRVASGAYRYVLHTPEGQTSGTLTLVR